MHWEALSCGAALLPPMFRIITLASGITINGGDWCAMIGFYIRRRREMHGRYGSLVVRSPFAFAIRCLLSVLALAISGDALAGCTASALSGPRQRIANHRYVEAHQQLAALLAHPERLTANQLTEARDGLCLTEFRIGAPAYPLREQRRVCAEAARRAGSQSPALLSAIDASIRTMAERRVEVALRGGDVADAEDAAFEYQSLPGADARKMVEWSLRMWRIVRERYAHRNAHRRRSLHRTIAKLRKRYARERRMSRETFLRWVRKQGVADGRRLFRPIALTRSRLALEVARTDVGAASLNLGRLTAVNDALAARCGCNARTEVAVSGTGFPLYGVFVDPGLERSEVLIFSHL